MVTSTHAGATSEPVQDLKETITSLVGHSSLDKQLQKLQLHHLGLADQRLLNSAFKKLGADVYPTCSFKAKMDFDRRMVLKHQIDSYDTSFSPESNWELLRINSIAATDAQKKKFINDRPRGVRIPGTSTNQLPIEFSNYLILGGIIIDGGGDTFTMPMLPIDMSSLQKVDHKHDVVTFTANFANLPFTGDRRSGYHYMPSSKFQATVEVNSEHEYIERFTLDMTKSWQGHILARMNKAQVMWKWRYAPETNQVLLTWSRATASGRMLLALPVAADMTLSYSDIACGEFIEQGATWGRLQSRMIAARNTLQAKEDSLKTPDERLLEEFLVKRLFDEDAS